MRTERLLAIVRNKPIAKVGVWEKKMIATILLASAHLAAPTTATTVNFVHSYEKNQKSTYDIYIASEVEAFEAYGEFDLAIKSTLEKGTMKASFTFSKLEVDGNDMSGMFPALDFELDKHGVPQQASAEQSAFIAFMALLSTYLPDEQLDEGGKF